MRVIAHREPVRMFRQMFYEGLNADLTPDEAHQRAERFVLKICESSFQLRARDDAYTVWRRGFAALERVRTHGGSRPSVAERRAGGSPVGGRAGAWRASSCRRFTRRPARARPTTRGPDAQRAAPAARRTAG